MRRWAASLGSLGFLVLAPGTVAGIVPFWLTRWRVTAAWPLALRGAGLLLLLAGGAVLLDAFARFALQGLGTPAPVAPTRHLVLTGLYRHVRNPMYLAVLSLVCGQALLLGDAGLLVYAACLWTAFHLFVTGYEEPTLNRAYGADYERYRAAVPRWRPRLRPWRAGGT